MELARQVLISAATNNSRMRERQMVETIVASGRHEGASWLMMVIYTPEYGESFSIDNNNNNRL